MARRGDGEPGWQTLWLGAQRLLLMLLGAELAGRRSETWCG
ncbi:IS4 family transposase [Paracraurococcus lichenis]